MSGDGFPLLTTGQRLVDRLVQATLKGGRAGSTKKQRTEMGNARKALEAYVKRLEIRAGIKTSKPMGPVKTKRRKGYSARQVSNGTKWRVDLSTRLGGKNRYLGRYDTREEAIAVGKKEVAKIRSQT